jgi:hypothetical protein
LPAVLAASTFPSGEDGTFLAFATRDAKGVAITSDMTAAKRNEQGIDECSVNAGEAK